MVKFQLPKDDAGSNGNVDISELPVLASFPGGLPMIMKEKRTAGHDDDGSNKSLHFQWKTHERTHQRTLVGKDKSCTYSTTEPNNDDDVGDKKEEGPVELKQYCTKNDSRICVGIYDKQKKTVTLHEIGFNGQVLPMAQAVKGYTGANNDDEDPDEALKRRSLFQDFGSAKKRRAMKSQEANRVNVETVVGAGKLVMNSVLAGESMSLSNKRAIEEEREQREAAGSDAVAATANMINRQMAAVELATEKWRKDFLPSYDTSASQACNVYDTAALVGGALNLKEFAFIIDKVMEKENIVSALVDGQKRNESIQLSADSSLKPRRNPRDSWQPSVVALLERIARRNSETSLRKKNLVCAYGLHWMLHLYKTLKTSRRIKPVDPERTRYFGAPLPFARFWLKTFTSESINPNNDGTVSYVMSKPGNDKCCVHMLLLLLSADGGKSMHCEDLRPFLDDSGIEISKASNLLREAGCAVVNKGKNGSMSATLTTPLTFPKVGSVNLRR